MYQNKNIFSKKQHILPKNILDISNTQNISNMYSNSSMNQSDFMASNFEEDDDYMLKEKDFQGSTDSVTQDKDKKYYADLSYYKEKLKELLSINAFFKKQCVKVQTILSSTVSIFHEIFVPKSDKLSFFQSFDEEDFMEEAVNMAFYIKNSISSLASEKPKNDDNQNQEEMQRQIYALAAQNKNLLAQIGHYKGNETHLSNQLALMREKVEILKKENSILTFNNENLVKYIEERKKYSESLKTKITKLKEEIKLVAEQDEKNRIVLEEIEKFQSTMDLKYANRNDLISMIKYLLSKVVKNSKQNPLNAEIMTEEFKEKKSKSNQVSMKMRDNSPLKQLQKKKLDSSQSPEKRRN